VEFVTRPEPDPEEREAVALALERLFAANELPPAYASRWRAAGIAENLDGEGDPDWATARQNKLVAQ
jgi:hypothetical protein